MRHPPFQMCARRKAFSLLEMLVTLATLGILLVMVSELFRNAQKVTGMGNQRMDADEQARALFDRMAIDISQMVNRADVDYYLKDSVNLQAGNDQMAFFSQVPGYYPPTGSQSPISVVGYRVNSDPASPSYQRLERIAYGLLWSGASASGTDISMVFSGTSSSSGTNTLTANWPVFGSTSSADTTHCEIAGPDVFRMECYYILKGQALSSGTFPSQASSIPWDARIAGHASVNGLRDVAAIGVVIAVVDAQNRQLVQNADLASLLGSMKDFPQTDAATGLLPAQIDPATGLDLTKPGGLEAQWRNVLDKSALSKQFTANVRIYRRWLYFSTKSNLDN